MISDAVLLSLIAAVPPTVVSLVGLVVTLSNNRKLNVVKAATDGMKDALVAATDKAATATGKAAGVESERVRSESKGPLP